MDGAGSRGPVIDVQHVLHRVHERGVLFRRNAEPLYLPRPEFAFFRPRRTELLLYALEHLELDELVGQQP